MKENEKNKYLEIMAKVNPFGLTTHEGYLMHYDNAVEAYYMMLLKIFGMCPRGYIDLPLVMHTYQRESIIDAVRYCRRKEIFLLRSWDISDYETVNTLREVLTIMLEVTGVPFDENAYQGAMYKFRVFFVQNKLDESTQKNMVEEKNYASKH
mgnify:CR=1 FL=1